MALEVQAAIEQAVLGTIRGIPGEKVSYGTANSGRTFDAEPPPACPRVYVAVWSDLSRDSRSDTCLDELFGCKVTITHRGGERPWDDWRVLRDEVERRANAIRAAVHVDCLNNRIQREASALMAADGAGQKVGLRECLRFKGFAALQKVGPDWFKASLDSASMVDAGLALTMSFHGLRLIQSLATME